MKLKTKELMIVVMLVIVVGGLSYYFGYFTKERGDFTNVCFDNNLCFKAEIADENNERLTGLMNRTYLSEGNGMLFVWDKGGYYPFWMKDTLIPLDMVWISADKKVVFIYENAQPCLEEPCQIIYPEGNAMYVLEINAGKAAELGIVVGNEMTIG